MWLTYSGGYLNYVTPRMKPYLYGMSALMFLWAVFTGRYLLTPRYRVKMARSFVFIIPILLLVFHPADPRGSSMVRSYESSGFSMSSGNGGALPLPELQPKSERAVTAAIATAAFFFHDALAVCAAIDETVLRDVRLCRVDVDCGGSWADGMTIVDPRVLTDQPENVHVAFNADREKFVSMLFDILGKKNQEDR